MRVKLLFFDSPRVRRAMDTATRQALGRAGAFIRRRAKSSIRRRKGISQPGQPPHSHAGHLRRLIFFGPVPFKQGEAPRLLEFGGTVTRRTRRRRRRMTYRKHPFMGPALAAELPQLPQRWRNSVRG